MVINNWQEKKKEEEEIKIKLKYLKKDGKRKGKKDRNEEKLGNSERRRQVDRGLKITEKHKIQRDNVTDSKNFD